MQFISRGVLPKTSKFANTCKKWQNQDVSAEQGQTNIARVAVPIYPARRTTFFWGQSGTNDENADLDTATQTELEAAAFRRLGGAFYERKDVQNIDVMDLAGFCRNCLSNGTKLLGKKEARRWIMKMSANGSTACPMANGKRWKYQPHAKRDNRPSKPIWPDRPW